MIPVFADLVRQQAIPTQHAAHRFHPRPRADHPDRDARFLNGRRWRVGERVFLHRIVLSGIAERLPVPQPREDVQPLVHQLRARFAVGDFAKCFEAAVHGAQPHRENHAPAGQVIERGRFAGQLPGPHPRNRGEHGAQPDALRFHGGSGQRDPGVRRPDRFPGEDRVPTGRFSFLGKVSSQSGIKEGENETVLHRPAPVSFAVS